MTIPPPDDVDLTCVDLTKLSPMTRFRLFDFISSECTRTSIDPESWPWPPTSATGKEMYGWYNYLRGIHRALKVPPTPNEKER